MDCHRYRSQLSTVAGVVITSYTNRSVWVLLQVSFQVTPAPIGDEMLPSRALLYAPFVAATGMLPVRY